MFKVGLSGFRVFERVPSVDIRPLTVLTGGNSSGKSSFLAALRILSDFSRWESGSASFNKDPFFLGSYDQIAHHRGGRYGRVKDFSLFYNGKPRSDIRSLRLGTEQQLPTSASIVMTYKKRLGQPVLSNLSYSSDLSRATFSYSTDWASVKIEASLGEATFSRTMNSDELPPPELITSQPIYMSSLLDRMIVPRSEGSDYLEASRQIRQVSRHLETSFNIVPQIGFVGAPVRTRPLRTYDPIDITPQSEGSHVPSQMAQLARTKPSEWERTRAELVKFGQTSGLFKDLEVRTLGRGDSDPFQVNVVINGPKRNIVDVGYGVSQAIPIVFELSRRRRDLLYMMQQPEVHLHPEAQAALGSFLVGSVKRNPGYIVLETHSDFLIDRLRRHVRNGEIGAEDIALLYFHRDDFSSSITQLELNDAGEITGAPDDYRRFFLREQIENLGF
ncbi:MAG: AAA family ATPase [Caulobacteraceae bacterium]